MTVELVDYRYSKQPGANITKKIVTLLLACIGMSVMAAPADLTTFFPIGVAQQPTNRFVTWKDRGINTLVDVPEGHSLEGWSAAAIQQGLYMIRRPNANPSADIGNANLLAWAHPLHPLAVDPPSFHPQQLRDESIAIRRMLPAQGFDSSLQPPRRSVRHGLAVER